jgi:hypothetical protein
MNDLAALLPAFVPFPKIPRLRRRMVVTEKLDGTNASVWVGEDGGVRAASRTRWITPEDDNYGFAAWVAEHADELRGLGPGAHFGEWWGRGVQRGYGLDHRRFSLFNVGRWAVERPECCHVVPVLEDCVFDAALVDAALARLSTCGSLAAPGFMRPEGVVVWHAAGGYLFKQSLERAEERKG